MRIKPLLKKLVVLLQIAKTSIYILIALLEIKVFKKNAQSHSNSNIWLIGENYGQCIFDNGFWFFEYCIRERKRNDVFFVIRKDALGEHNFPNIMGQKMLVYGAYEHIKTQMLANVLTFSHSPRDLIFPFLQKLLFKDQYTVFLNHGIFSLKKATKDQHSFLKYLDVFVVSSEREKQIIASNFSIDADKIEITGLARYDKLINDIPKSPKEILYIPTWRDWVSNIQSTPPYIHAILKFINSKELKLCLEKNDAVLTVHFHKSMADQCKNIPSAIDCENIQFSDTDPRTVQQLLQQSHLMITDYSSVSWDFIYLDKPVLFYQFDQYEHLSRKGSYINLNSELFGEVFTNSDSLIDTIEKYLIGNFAKTSEYSRIRDLNFKYGDTNNCRRIYDTVMSSIHKVH